MLERNNFRGIMLALGIVILGITIAYLVVEKDKLYDLVDKVMKLRTIKM